MRRTTMTRHALASAMLASGLMAAGGLAYAAAPCNPCAARDRKGSAAMNPCAANPCAAKNPCAANPCAANPCAAKNPCAATNPCAASANPCAGANPCTAKAVKRPAGYTPYRGNHKDLAAKGEKLFNDTSLSSNGMSCNTCHVNGASYAPTFKEDYPHKVAMAADAGVKKIHLDEMVQLCMVTPMATEPLDWKSETLAALVAYTSDEQTRYRATMASSGDNPCAAKNPCAANPCAAKNPCAANPCAANPCAAKNPCAGKNPCAANPCAAKNPCAGSNPCKPKKSTYY